jgi:hypothetical protein
VLPYLHAAEVFVLPSEREGLPNALLDAMACGVACVVPADAEGDPARSRTRSPRSRVTPNVGAPLGARPPRQPRAMPARRWSTRRCASSKASVRRVREPRGAARGDAERRRADPPSPQPTTARASDSPRDPATGAA